MIFPRRRHVGQRLRTADQRPGVGVITPAPLTITAAGVDKVYDGTSTATVTLSDNRIAGDVFTDSYTAAVFADKNVGASKPVSVSGLAVTGRDAGDSHGSIPRPTPRSASPRPPLTITADNQTKVYGAALPTLTASYSGFVNGDTAASLTTPADADDHGHGRQPRRRQPLHHHRQRRRRHRLHDQLRRPAR